MADLFGVLAAIVPIIGATWAAGSALRRHKARTIERDFRRELQTRQTEWNEECRALGKRVRDRTGMAWSDWTAYQECSERVSERTQRQLLYRGYAPEPGYLEVGIDVAMDGKPLAGNEIRDQWIMLGSSAAGVVFLALSWILAP